MRGNITSTMTPPTPPRKKLPIGIQTLSEIRQAGYHHVDKTALILWLLGEGENRVLFTGLQAIWSSQRLHNQRCCDDRLNLPATEPQHAY